MQSNFVIENPKRRPSPVAGRDQWFPYYAGFSSDFARKLIQSSEIDRPSTFMDPWNGSGTSTAAAALCGHKAVGFDLNPVMVVVAKARLLPNFEKPSIAPLLSEIANKSLNDECFLKEDPLLTWFTPAASARIRSIDSAIHILLICADQTKSSVESVSQMSSIASFFYVALFRTVRQLLQKFEASNPTWVTRPSSLRSRIRPSAKEIQSIFGSQVREMASDIKAEMGETPSANVDFMIDVASSERLPIDAGSIDLVLSSPPYCTRIDYGVATSPELAVLGLPLDTKLRELRGALIGTPTIQGKFHQTNKDWGATCNSFLEQVTKHPSKAAKSYYYKTYAQYFKGIAKSISEIARCLKPNGQCVIVIQDSYFKGIRADLATIFSEIASANQMALSRRVDFPLSRSFAYINTKSRSYGGNSTSVESVLCYTKN